ncbi:MAG: NADH-quinone oxidoreductase subunit N [Bacteroidota bacterium]
MEFSLDLLSQSLQQVAPLMVLLTTGLALMLMDSFKATRGLAWVAGIGLATAGAWLLADMGTPAQTAFSGMIATGGISSLIAAMLTGSGLLTLFFLEDYLRRQEKPITDVYALVVFAVLGMILMANARDLLMAFIGLETMSMCLYVFAALYKMDPRSNESGLKYFLLGSFASAFLLFGIALIYGMTGYVGMQENATTSYVAGTTQYSQIAEQITYLVEHPELVGLGGIGMEERRLVFFLAVGLILVGFLFKVAAFPFHNWTPDVYEGTPTPLAGFMATGSKMAAFVTLGNILMELDLLSEANSRIVLLMALIALFTMIYGNLVAARQQNIKRMLAYSSIAHTGYVLLGLCAGKEGFIAVIFYMFIYTLMNIGAFGVVGMAERDYPDTHLKNWKGFGTKFPYLAGALSIFMLSLAGFPPLAGFMSKLEVFLAAIDAELVFLAVVGILASLVGAYYYIRVIVMMFFQPSDKVLTPTSQVLPRLGITLLVALVILLGIFPSLVLEPIEALFSGGVTVAIQQ